MPQKTSKTTRKHGTVTEIKLYADEVRTLSRAESLLAELRDLLSREDPDFEELNRAVGVLAYSKKYTHYKSNGQADTTEAPDA